MSARILSWPAASAAIVFCAWAASCGQPQPPADRPGEGLSTPASGASGEPAASSAVVIAFLGDSLTAGLGLDSQAYPARVQEMLEADGFQVETLNGGISGDTTAGGLRRYEQLLTGGTKILVIALGANDALRGLTVAQTHDNLAAIIDGTLAHDVAVVLVGMEAPPNLGDDYRIAFREVFTKLLREYRTSISFVPFLLEGVAGNPALNQADGIHPNEQGTRIVAATVYPKVRDLVDRMTSAGAR